MWFRGKRRVCGSGPKPEGVGAGWANREKGPRGRWGATTDRKGPGPPDSLTHVPKPEVGMFLWTLTILNIGSTLYNFLIEIIIKLGGKNACWLKNERLHKAGPKSSADTGASLREGLRVKVPKPGCRG